MQTLIIYILVTFSVLVVLTYLYYIYVEKPSTEISNSKSELTKEILNILDVLEFYNPKVAKFSNKLRDKCIQLLNHK